jgi:hypothetical protein
MKMCDVRDCENEATSEFLWCSRVRRVCLSHAEEVKRSAEEAGTPLPEFEPVNTDEG